MKNFLNLAKTISFVFALSLLVFSGNVFAQRSNGTTLAASKTLDICAVNDTTWRYSGEISVWNEGVIDTVGLNINDLIEYKPGNKWLPAPFNVPVTLVPNVIPAGTTEPNAIIYLYGVDGPALPGYIRNTANVTITNHSGSLGKNFGPSPKYTYSGSIPPPACPTGSGCVRVPGYLGTHYETWPQGFDPNTLFYSTGYTWGDILPANGPVDSGNKYFKLAKEYIAVLINQGNGASVPSGVQTYMNLSAAWFSANTPASCPNGGSCGTQNTWAQILHSYNSGTYPGGPSGCGDNASIVDRKLMKSNVNRFKAISLK